MNFLIINLLKCHWLVHSMGLIIPEQQEPTIQYQLVYNKNWVQFKLPRSTIENYDTTGRHFNIHIRCLSAIEPCRGFGMDVFLSSTQQLVPYHQQGMALWVGHVVS